jgi:hypothetical protein
MLSPRKDPGFLATWIVVTLCVASLWLFRGPLTWNETSRIPVAKHFVDPSWIPTDWFLNTSTLYQVPFNLLAAPLVACLDLSTAAILLRFILYLWFASGVVALTRRLEIGLVPLLPAIMTAVAYRMRSLAADEWMVGHADAKTVAYGAALWAFSMLLGKRYRTAAAFLGLATTFHILVGLYATLTSLLFLLIHPRHRRAMTKTLPMSISAYLITGAFGVFVVLHTLTSTGQGDGFPDLIYIARSRHHLWPPAWWGGAHLHLPISIDRFAWEAKAAMSVSFLALISVWSRFRPFREFAHLALLSSLFFVMGLLIFLLGPISLLKYYPFRFPDVLLPFASILLFFGLWERIGKDSTTHRISSGARNSLRIGLHVVAALVVVTGLIKTVSHLEIKWRENVPWPYVPLSLEDREATRWIQHNTPPDALFLADPYLESFYVTAERGVLVCVKHLPSRNDDLKEWHGRLVAVNRGQEVLLDSLEIDREQIRRSFGQLPLENAQDLARMYSLDYYYGPFREDWDLSPLHRVGDKAIYKLP